MDKCILWIKCPGGFPPYLTPNEFSFIADKELRYAIRFGDAIQLINSGWIPTDEALVTSEDIIAKGKTLYMRETADLKSFDVEESLGKVLRFFKHVISPQESAYVASCSRRQEQRSVTPHEQVAKFLEAYDGSRPIIINVQGGSRRRAEAARSAPKSELYYIGGLGNGEDLGSFCKALVETRSALAVDDAQYFSHSNGTPAEVAWAVYHGVYNIITDFPIILGEKGFILKLNLEPVELESELESESDPPSQSNRFNVLKLADKLPESLWKEPLFNKEYESEAKDYYGDVTLHYVHHMFNTHELLGPVLCITKNLLTYRQFIKELNRYALQGKLKEYVSWFLKCNCNSGDSSLDEVKQYVIPKPYTVL